MTNESHIPEIDILLAAYFSGEATAAERSQVENWAKASSENKAYFEASQKAWNVSGATTDNKSFNTDAAWKQLHSKMHNASQPAKRNYSWLAAAGVVLVLGIAYLITQMGGTDPVAETFMVTSADNIIDDTLPDGSIISMNRSSSLTFQSESAESKREVTLKGEAFFDVTHDAERPFVIHTEKMDIKVLGTSFNVRSYPGTDSVHVSVKTGQVQCVSNADTVVIQQGEFAVFHSGDQTITKGTDENPNRIAYRDRIFRFDNTPLGVAVQQLNEAYGCNIVLKNQELAGCSFSVTKVFYNEPVENILETIVLIFPDMTRTKEGNTILLDGTGCK